ncbi:hypothetical protein TWF718_003458 [Orbilia javanica]|uniref:Uncharacterized protein n=1 Tax=Orbilia javanica TaxID=47235 RepID=A0AAN8MNN6_9PEZI
MFCPKHPHVLRTDKTPTTFHSRRKNSISTMDPEKGPIIHSVLRTEEDSTIPLFNHASRHTSCPNSLDCYNGHSYLITTDHLLGARFPADKDYHTLHKTYKTTQTTLKTLWLTFTITALYSLYSIHYTSTSTSPCRPSLHNATEPPTLQDRKPFLILDLRVQDFYWCLLMVLSILSSTVVLWRADARLEAAVEMRRRRGIHGLPIWPPEVDDRLKVGIESWRVNLMCFLVTLGVTVVWSWSVWAKVQAERRCRVLLN